MIRVVILGGYGNFGKRIAENLGHSHSGLEVIIAGRDPVRAQKLCTELEPILAVGSLFKPCQMDIDSPSFARDLAALRPMIVIHTSGPFQGQDYRVPLACIAAGAHCIDLADARGYVCNIQTLDGQAKARNILIVSGASSVPGLSSTVIDHFREEFASLENIDFAIAPGNKAEVGEATLKGILSYTGHAFPVLREGTWQNLYGWLGGRRIDFGEPIGHRWLANIDIPDLELFPARYAGVRNVRFQAGLELPLLHFVMATMAQLAKWGVVADWSRWAALMLKARRPLIAFGSDVGGMRIELTGKSHSGEKKHLLWTLCAKHGVGPYIPTLSAIILAGKLLRGEIAERGAMPCLGLFSLAEFDAEAAPMGIYYRVTQ